MVEAQSLLRLRDVMRITGLGKSSIYKFMRDGTFPKNFKLGTRASGWYASDILEWIAARRADAKMAASS